MNEALLSKLMDTMEDVKERLIRIEEGQKDLKDVKADLATAKIQVASLEQSNKSAHKRIDDLEKEQEKTNNSISWAVKIVLGLVIAAVLGLVLIQQ